ncbi:VWA domain-containing protein [Azospirillum sp. SYSU D00513]|uniref:nitric oxide reductase activation protein NorD n=1 Tax=Azospirillum sp. SYSU D00513 TaxID=2812561 RepID=UPI001A9565F2|nr:VWA domain-containing protein [Azospirillum sp. SYSU D00513]
MSEVPPRPEEAYARIRAEGGAGELHFSDVERQLRHFLTALWGRDVPMRALSAGGDAPEARRSGFDGGVIRLPDALPALAGQPAEALFRASLAHLAAHLIFSRRQLARGLKPLLMAVVGLVEDARVEHLAMRAFPGLRRLWLPFHVAEPSGALIAADLMERLSRALIDPGYEDANHWVAKGRALFFDGKDQWEDPDFSLRVGGLLAGDLGKMRVGLNHKTYLVEPAYRDDNGGLWEFDTPPQVPPDDHDLPLEAMRAEPSEGQEPDEFDGAARNDPAAASAPAGEADPEAGVPVARYPEWDYRIGLQRPGFARVVECPAPPSSPALIDGLLARDPGMVRRVARLVRAAKFSRPERLRRQAEGETLDLDACVEAAVERRLGHAPDPRVHAATRRRFRDLSVLVLLDVSQSTNDPVSDPAGGAPTTVLALERHATALLAAAMAEAGDRFAVHAFCSNGREEVRYQRVKDFGDPYDNAAKARLGGLRGRYSTRMGTALRHAGRQIAGQPTHRRLVLLITDGEPSDIDSGDRRYLIEDTRKAVGELAGAGVDVFCVRLGGTSAADARDPARIFGGRNVLTVERLERLPDMLPQLYFRLTA